MYQNWIFKSKIYCRQKYLVVNDTYNAKKLIFSNDVINFFKYLLHFIFLSAVKMQT